MRSCHRTVRPGILFVTAMQRLLDVAENAPGFAGSPEEQTDLRAGRVTFLPTIRIFSAALTNLLIYFDVH